MAASGMLGLIAGEGRFPLELARAAKGAGYRVHAVGFRELTDPALEVEVDQLRWLHLGEIDALLEQLRKSDVRQAVMVGKVSKEFLFRDQARLHLDARARALLSELGSRSDASILGLIADELEGEGIELLEQHRLAPHLTAREGQWGQCEPSVAQLADMAFGWEVAKALGEVDVGQTVVVRDRAILALEAIEGTDAAILRGGELGGGGVCVVKVAKPGQDPRFDLPVVGPRTLESMLAAGGTSLAVEADRTLVLDRDTLVAAADRHAIPLMGFSAEAPPRLQESVIG